MPSINKFSGINNVASPALAGPSDLQTCLNMLVGNRNELKIRPGYSVLSTPTTPHSIFMAGSKVYFGAGQNLSWKAGAGHETIWDGLTTNSKIGYLYLGGRVYFGNGTENGIIVSGERRSWGITVPSAPTVTTEDIVGGIPAGRYAISVTLVRADGSESGASEPVDVVLAEEGGIELSALPQNVGDDIVGIAVYMSLSGGEVMDNGSGMYLIATDTPTSNDFADIVLDAASTGEERKCQTLNMYPPPVGSVFCFYRGRVFIGAGNIVWFTRPWAYELCEIDKAYLPVRGTITNLLPAENGIWVTTTEECLFIAGRTPSDDGGGFQIKNRYPVAGGTGGVTTNTMVMPLRGMAPGPLALWMTEDGVFVGDSAGTMLNATDNVWVPPSSVTTASGAIMTFNGTQYYVMFFGGTVYAMNLKNRAVSKLDFPFTSATMEGDAMYAVGSGGLFRILGTDDDGSPITFDIAKSGVTHGTKLLKRWTDMEIRGRIDGDVTVSVTANGVTGSVVVTGSGPNNESVKVDLPRGLSGESLAFRIQGTDGEHADIREIEMITEVSATRKGRSGRA